MKIGYPCINLSIGCRADRTFRLKSYSEERLIETVDNNLNCLLEILRFNEVHNVLFFRITSDLVPFASHPICRFEWQTYFYDKFREIGHFIRKNGIRISMHPDQFTLIKSIDNEVFENSLRELTYHAEVLDLMELHTSAKIQIHVGGIYTNKAQSMDRFVERYEKLEIPIKRRLVVENDDRLYQLQDCLNIHRQIGIPILFDLSHHELNNSGETLPQALELVTKTWSQNDGLPMVDYSSSALGHSARRHSESIDLQHFNKFLIDSRPHDFDLMLEIKDKEKSAMKAIEIASLDKRFYTPGKATMGT